MNALGQTQQTEHRRKTHPTMIYLIMAIAAMSLIMTALKFFGVKGIYAPQAIMVNYGIALAIAVLSGREYITCQSIVNLLSTGWWYLALIAGLLYFGSMDIMAVSTRRVGVSITTMASRTAVILPIVWSAVFLGERITGWEAAGTLLVLGAFLLIIYRPQKRGCSPRGRRDRALNILMPIAVFLSVGFIAVCMKTSQHLIKTGGSYGSDYPVFETLLFTSAFLGSISYYVVTEGRKAFIPNWKSIVGGVCLGTFNYFVTVGLMHGLKYFSSSTFYGIYNIGVVLVATLVGTMVFGEKLDRLKIAGLSMAIAAIFILGFMGQSL